MNMLLGVGIMEDSRNLKIVKVKNCKWNVICMLKISYW